MEQLGPGDPQQIGAYRLQARLGAGGMGQVYLARSERGRTVAVKLVRRELAERAEFRDRFRKEVAAARRVGGAWTAPVLDADTEAEVPWLATGYVAGPSLQSVVASHHGPLPERSVRILGAGLAHALKDIHAAGLIHRDLKPSNVLLTIDGPRVIDFGIARALETTAEAALTRTGAVVGSPGFMAPEQVRGDRVTPAADVFCLGSVLAYAATGALPFGTANSGVHALMYRIAQEPPNLADVPENLQDLIGACLAKNPEDRPTPDRLLALTGADDTVSDGKALDPWLPGGLVAQLGRHAVRLLDREDPENGPAAEAAAPAGPSASAPAEASTPAGTPSPPATPATPPAPAPAPAPESAPTPPDPGAPGTPPPGGVSHLPTVVVGTTPPPPPQPTAHPHANPAPPPPPAQPQATPAPPAHAYGQPHPAYGYPQPHQHPGLAPTPPYGPAPLPAPARDRTPTVLLLVVAVIVALGAGAGVYAYLNGDDGADLANDPKQPSPTATADPGGSGTPNGDPTPAEGTPSGDEDDDEGDDEGDGDTVPAAFLGTWTTTIGTADERRLVLQQGEVGDTVLSLTATGPLKGSASSYRCVFQAQLSEVPNSRGPVRVGPSRVVVGEPMTSCSSGEATTLTLHGDGRLTRVNDVTGESLTYTKAG
ncbi:MULTISPECIES: serine/threonine-protein kinase [Streptomyces]|uniref:Serine/threonine protein kinase n=1 Tax=Streptomyces odorifer TaxID=53450 RepID=A0A7Y6F3L4_9ACTN|nr:serine/threonine-protein kinase [Streptomyces odorifer]NUV31250.1 serine/threonine protein kinase [Streptomyces odorifer]NUV35611.1 serine/threonine protein kinase [Streptomyces sp. KAI-27]